MVVILRTSYSLLLRLAIVCILVATFLQPASAIDVPPGTVVVARSSPDALLIWDASAAVGDLVIARTTGDDGLRKLEIEAVTLLAARSQRLHAKTVELRVQYVAGGVVGAAYQASTFANATPIMVLRADRRDVTSHYHQWIDDVAAQRTPHGLNVAITGKFPTPN